MPYPNFFTGVRMLQHPLAYAPAANPLAPTLHLRKGSFNVWSPVEGTPDRRPGLKELYSGPAVGLKIRRTETAEDGSLASTVYNETSLLYEIWVKPIAGAWLKIPEARAINDSISPHEMVWIRRRLYAKGNPAGETIGAIVFDLDEPGVAKWWGVLRPASPLEFRPTSEWIDSGSDRVTPRIGARYAYTYVTSSGHESSGSKFTDYSALEQGRYPRLRIPAFADAINVPFFNIYRSGDGGGGLYFAEQIANTGAQIDWNDENFRPGGNFISDLDESREIPGPTDNDPPPTVEEGTLGVDAIERSSPAVLWGSRIVFAVGRNIYYSVDDEAVPGSGRIEESFRGGSILSANRATIGEAVVDLVATDVGVVIFTRRNTYIMTGQRRSEIRFDLLLPEIGGYARHCSTAIGSAIYWLDGNLDLRFLQLSSERTELTPVIVSTALKGEHRADLTKYFQLDAQYVPDYTLVSLAVMNQTGSTTTPIPQEDATTVYVYDTARELWFSPWQIEASSIWKQFQVGKANAVGQLDVGTYTDFGQTFDARIVTSALLQTGESDLNISDVDYIFQTVDGVELVWTGADLTDQVKIGADLYPGPIYNAAAYLATERSDPIANEPIGMHIGTFGVPDGVSGRYFSLSLDIPREDALWSLLNALLIFGPLGDGRAITKN